MEEAKRNNQINWPQPCYLQLLKLKLELKKQSQKEGGDIKTEDKMDVDEETKPKVDAKESNDDEKKETKKQPVSDEPVTVRYARTPYKISNLSRVLPVQSNFISFIKDDRFVQ